jgi:hypothetical protein
MGLLRFAASRMPNVVVIVFNVAWIQQGLEIFPLLEVGLAGVRWPLQSLQGSLQLAVPSATYS